MLNINLHDFVGEKVMIYIKIEFTEGVRLRYKGKVESVENGTLRLVDVERSYNEGVSYLEPSGISSVSPEQINFLAVL